MPRRCAAGRPSRPSRTRRRPRSRTRPTGSGWRWAAPAACSGSGTRSQDGGSAHCSTPRLDRAPIRARPSRSRAATTARSRGHSRSVPGTCSPPRASAGSCGSGISIRGSRSARRSSLPPFVIGLAFSPDGSQLAIPFGYSNPGPDGVEVIDVQSGERIARLRCRRRGPFGRLLPGRRPAGERPGRRQGGSLGDRGLAAGRAAAARRSRVRARGRLLPGRPDACHIQRRRHGRRSGTWSPRSRSARPCPVRAPRG